MNLSCRRISKNRFSHFASSASRGLDVKNSVLLPGQHPEPFSNFREIGCAPLALKDWSKNIAPTRSVDREAFSVKGDWGYFHNKSFRMLAIAVHCLLQMFPLFFRFSKQRSFRYTSGIDNAHRNQFQFFYLRTFGSLFR